MPDAAHLPRRGGRPPPWFQTDNLAVSLCRRRRRPPSRDDPHALPPPGVVGDQREVPPQLENSRQLALLVEHTADGLGSGFIDAEHGPTMQETTQRRQAKAPPMSALSSLALAARQALRRDRNAMIPCHG